MADALANSPAASPGGSFNGWRRWWVRWEVIDGEAVEEVRREHAAKARSVADGRSTIASAWSGSNVERAWRETHAASRLPSWRLGKVS